jgi:hypothetical protein
MFQMTAKLILKNWSRNKMSGQPLDEILRNKIDRFHKKQIDEKMPEMYAKTVLKSLPDTEIMTSNTVINYVKQNSSLDDENTIINGINTLLDWKELISTDNGGKVYIRKNNLKGIVD